MYGPERNASNVHSLPGDSKVEETYWVDVTPTATLGGATFRFEVHFNIRTNRYRHRPLQLSINADAWRDGPPPTLSK